MRGERSPRSSRAMSVQGTGRRDLRLGRRARRRQSPCRGAPAIQLLGRQRGSAYLFSRDPVDRDKWVFVTRLAAADTGSANDGFGAPLALEGDTAVVGAPSAEAQDGDQRAGAVYQSLDATRARASGARSIGSRLARPGGSTTSAAPSRWPAKPCWSERGPSPSASTGVRGRRSSSGAAARAPTRGRSTTS